MAWLVQMAKDDARQAQGDACPEARWGLKDAYFDVYIQAFEDALNDQALKGR